MKLLNLIKGYYKSQKQFENLDLDYITNRIIAMAYPGEKMKEILKHNNMNDVIFHLKKYHNGLYKIYNLSGIPYDPKKFDNNVEIYYWKDHHAPPLYELFKVIISIRDFLNLNSNNIVCIHCLAGKGRTGVVIVCFLLYSSLFNEKQALDYFSIKRKGKINLGVQQPGQLRYVNLFYNLLYNPHIKRLNVKCFEIDKIEIKNIDKSEKNNLYIELNIYYPKNDSKIISNNGKYIICGDFVITIKQKVAFLNPILCWICYHTYLMDENKNSISFYINDIDPHTFHSNDKYKKMIVEVLYHPYKNTYFDINANYYGGGDEQKINEIIQIEEQKIYEINNIIEEFRKKNDIEKKYQGHNLLFGGNQDDINKILYQNNI